MGVLEKLITKEIERKTILFRVEKDISIKHNIWIEIEELRNGLEKLEQ